MSLKQISKIFKQNLVNLKFYYILIKRILAAISRTNVTQISKVVPTPSQYYVQYTAKFKFLISDAYLMQIKPLMISNYDFLEHERTKRLVLDFITILKTATDILSE